MSRTKRDRIELENKPADSHVALSRMLDSMAGLTTGTRDALARFTQPLIGSYYFVPSVESLRRLRGDPAPTLGQR